ncbi:MFS transporter [Muricoccus radiodurans]|uniref:MFS transporter n=1 Tax=Muricoccus radiodurans TaxID=2231721 RepID=UPI003CF70903
METDPDANGPAGRPPALFRSTGFRRLWAVGGITNTMRWLELLAATLFTYEVTGSGLAVAVVAAARSLPLLLFGAIAGVVCEAVSRKRILLGGMLLSTSAALVIALLAALGRAEPWHLACAAFLSGIVWATDMSARRRMVGEVAGPDHMSRAVALDSLTNSCARMAGPLAGGALYAWTGVLGAFLVSSLCYLLAALLIPGVAYRQERRPLVLRGIVGELADSFAYALRDRTILTVMAVTATMNLFAFSYTALVAPLARGVFDASDVQAGLLAAGEPLGGLLGGLLLARWVPKAGARHLMIAGSALFTIALAAMPLMPSYHLACLVLVAGGVGLALFSNMQTTLILAGTPAHLRSRQLGLVTVCIGLGPLGQLLLGALAAAIGARHAVIASAVAAFVALVAIAVRSARRVPAERLGSAPGAPSAQVTPEATRPVTSVPPRLHPTERSGRLKGKAACSGDGPARPAASAHAADRRVPATPGAPRTAKGGDARC